MAKNKILTSTIIFLFISVGLNLFLAGKLTNKNSSPSSSKNQVNDEFYRFVKPLSQAPIDSNTQADGFIIHFLDLKPQIEAEIQKYTSQQNIGFFLQDIQTGAWLGINERERFVPASLLKIPIMMAVLKKVEREEIKLSDTIEIINEDLDQYSGHLFEKGSGAKFTVWDLTKEMILASDNTAKNALKRQVSVEELNAVFTHVGIPNPYLKENDQTVTPRGMTRIFKSLYFATFLKPDLSEKALDVTTDTKVENLLSTGIPPEIQVAHKFGERTDGLHDCGIVYQPKNPYLICIMTKNLTIPKAKELINNLSKTTYDFVAGKTD